MLLKSKRQFSQKKYEGILVGSYKVNPKIFFILGFQKNVDVSRKILGRFLGQFAEEILEKFVGILGKYRNVLVEEIPLKKLSKNFLRKTLEKLLYKHQKELRKILGKDLQPFMKKALEKSLEELNNSLNKNCTMSL